MSIVAESMQLSILVVDDEEPVRELLGWMLEDCGFTVHAAPGGHDALAFLRTQKLVDIVVSDINMPDMDGVMLSRHIEAEFPTLPVLLISGRPRPDGVRAFIAKPFRLETLTEKILKLTTASPRNLERRRQGANGQRSIAEQHPSLVE